MIDPSSLKGKRAERVSDYVLAEVLGTGSFGQVVLGVHQHSKKRVAIKMLPKEDDESAVRRISGEVSTMEKVGAGCPFIVQLYEVLVGRNHIYLVVELAGGGELFKAFFKPADDVSANDIGSPERTERARIYFQQLLFGLHWCHQHGVAHRDLKPQNLLLSTDGVLKIADFGLAASFNPEPAVHAPPRSMRQTMCGSPLYMAPEMLSLRNGEAYDAIATDAWGCGAVLHAMLLGRPPFPATTFDELVNLASRPQTNLRLPPSIPKELTLLIRAMLRLDAKQRYTLSQVAQTAWFQEGLASTLALVPGFQLPRDILPRALTERGTVLNDAEKNNRSAKSISIGVVQQRAGWADRLCALLRALLSRRRARVHAAKLVDAPTTRSRTQCVEATNSPSTEPPSKRVLLHMLIYSADRRGSKTS